MNFADTYCCPACDSRDIQHDKGRPRNWWCDACYARWEAPAPWEIPNDDFPEP